VSGSAAAENYAEALFELAAQTGDLELFGRLIDATAAAIASSVAAQSVLMNPKVTKTMKADLLTRSLEAVGAPRPFALYLRAVVKRGRQRMLSAIAESYRDLVDAKLGRVRAHVTVARQPDQALATGIAAALSKNLGKEVLPSFTVDREILGGVLVRVGDRVYDGSLKRRLLRLRRQLLR
jgi:F-type H+-transporting ATPase subunit delta